VWLGQVLLKKCYSQRSWHGHELAFSSYDDVSCHSFSPVAFQQPGLVFQPRPETVLREGRYSWVIAAADLFEEPLLMVEPAAVPQVA
jgi:hypothetical protein